MIKINLLPENLRKKERPIGNILLLVSYMLLGVTLIYWAFSLFMVKYTENNLNEVKQNLSALHVWQERYELDQVQLGEINKRENIVKTKITERMVWYQSLAELGNTTPFGAWLVSVTQDKTNPHQIQIKGKALRMENILDFISRLQADVKVARVDLVETQQGRATGVSGAATTFDFTLNVLRNEEGKK